MKRLLFILLFISCNNHADIKHVGKDGVYVKTFNQWKSTLN